LAVLFVGDDWAEDHHDVEVQDQRGRRLGRARLDEGVVGIARLHKLIGAHVGEDTTPDQVVVGIETDRGVWVQALVAAGYRVYAINPMQVARFREATSTSGGKSDPSDAQALAGMVRLMREQLRPVAGDSTRAEAVKVLARAHQTLIWEQTRHTLRLRSMLREFFPAALHAFGEDLDARDALELLAAAPEPVAAAGLPVAQITAALKRARRRGVAAKAAAIQAALRTEHLSQSVEVAAAYAAGVRAQAALLTTLAEQIKLLEQQVEANFGKHPDVKIYRSQPGLGVVSGARVLAEFGDDNQRYASAKARKNYAGTSPITRQSGKKKIVFARYVRNDRLIDALMQQAFTALRVSPGARAYYDRHRTRGLSHRAALRQLANRLVGILHGCLKTGTLYNEATAWPTHEEDLADAA
jgi:transposase